MKRLILSVLLVSIGFFAAPSAFGQTTIDRHAGYYYPPPKAIETYRSKARKLAGVNRRRRIAFVVAMANNIQARPYPPYISVFVKGTRAQKLIITAAQDGRLDTIYRVRGLLARMTSVARATPIFREFQVADLLNFLDLLKMLGFEQITVSNGRDFAHQILIK